MLIVVVCLLNVKTRSHQKIVLVVLGKNVVAGKVFTRLTAGNKNNLKATTIK